MEIRCLVLELNCDVAICFNRENHKLIHVKIEYGKSASPGQFIIYDTRESVEEDGILRALNLKIVNAEKEDGVKLKNGKLELSSWIAFSSDEHHRTFDRKLAYADWYGFVDCSETSSNPSFSSFKSDITINDLKKKEKPIFKVVRIKTMIVPKLNEKSDYDSLMEKMKKEEEEFLRKITILDSRPGQLIPERPSRSIDERNTQIPSMHRKKSRSRSRNSRTRMNDYGPPINISSSFSSMNISGLSVPLIQSFFETSSSTNTSNFNPIPPPISSLPLVSPFVMKGLVLRKEQEIYFIIWLFDIKQLAYLSISNLGYVIVGVCYEFNAILKVDGSAYEITNVGKRLETKSMNSFEIHQKDEQVDIGIHVDLCSPNIKCQIWSFYMDIPFFNSPDVGIVTMADYVDTPTEYHQRWQEALRLYLGDPRAQSMKCICQLVKQKLPRKLNDSFVSDDFVSFSRYIWQIVEICLSEQHHQIKEKQLKHQNLGSNAGEIEKEDDIARQKRENRRNVRFDGNI